MAKGARRGRKGASERKRDDKPRSDTRQETQIQKYVVAVKQTILGVKIDGTTYEKE